MRFKGEVAVVTGAGSGIGKAITKALIKEGAKVSVADINEELCKKTVMELNENGGEAIDIVADVSKSVDAKKIIDTTVNQYGKIDVLVNNAGVLKDTRIGDMDEEDWDKVIDACLKGTFLCSKFSSSYMINQNKGKIVNISSRAYLGNPGQSNYSSAKAGVIGITKSLAKELGKYNVNVNAVAPGMIDTDALRAHPKYDKIKQIQEKNTPIPRIGEMTDVANAVLFLASDEAKYITGDTLHVSGGRFG